jgi:hypothetical protein
MRIADHRLETAVPAGHCEADQARAGLTAFFSIARDWGLDSEQQRRLLGGPGRTTFFEWKRSRRGKLSRDTLDRLSYLLGIYKALHILFPERTVLEWLNHPNTDPLFNGQAPMEHLLRGDLVALAEVRRYLDQARG